MRSKATMMCLFKQKVKIPLEKLWIGFTGSDPLEKKKIWHLLQAAFVCLYGWIHAKQHHLWKKFWKYLQICGLQLTIHRIHISNTLLINFINDKIVHDFFTSKHQKIVLTFFFRSVTTWFIISEVSFSPGSKSWRTLPFHQTTFFPCSKWS